MRARAAISNIAWPADADEEAVALAADLGFSGIELAPGKVFGGLDVVSDAELRRYCDDLAARGLAIPALQAILFGVSDAHLFESSQARQKLAERLTRVADVAGELGAGACVFGSPALRDPGERSNDEAMAIAADFFAGVAPRFAENNTILAFEANPPIYNCRFVTRTTEAINLVKRVNAPGFGLQLDMGTVFANDEDQSTVEAAGRMAAHCHVSEPHLGPLSISERNHPWAGSALAKINYEGWVSVEMKAINDWRSAIRNAAAVVGQCY